MEAVTQSWMDSLLIQNIFKLFSFERLGMGQKGFRIIKLYSKFRKEMDFWVRKESIIYQEVNRIMKGFRLDHYRIYRMDQERI